jgi:3-oxosteroid 1-dehydrogenase
MERLGLEDSVEDTLRYITELTAVDEAIFEPAVARQWVESARVVARWLEERGDITWEIIPGYHDYYWPRTPGSREQGRYLTGALFPAGRLGEARDRLIPAPSWPVGVTYGEMFDWGGQVSRTSWDWDLVRQRQAEIREGHTAVALLTEGDAVVGVRCDTPAGPVEARGPVILATGSHDWWDETERYTRIPRADAGSVAPPSLTGDAMALGAPVGVDTLSVPSWAAPVVPGYQLPAPQFPGDTGFRMCWEQSMPHSILVNERGERFCDDAFHPAVARALLTPDEQGGLPNLPFFLVWDEEHHRRYGLGPALPGAPYPDGLVTTAPTAAALAEALGVDPAGLEATLARYNADAAEGRDPDFGRGANPATARFRGDISHPLNPNVAPVSTPPFHGMRMKLVSTGITAAGLRSGLHGRAQRPDATDVPGLHAVGECSARTAGGAGYNSGYSLSRAMTFGWLAAHDVAAQRADR